jgi:uncharacterized protein YndB with AHSA1/START domain
LNRLEARVEISKGVDEVFDYLIAPAHMLEWMQGVLAVTAPSTGSLGVGSTFHLRWQLPGRVLETTYEVLVCEAGRAFTYQSTISSVRRLVSFRLEAIASGTRLTCSIEQELHSFFQHEVAMAAQATQRLLEAELQSLKKAVES